MKIWLALDPENEMTLKPRISFQDRPFDLEHMPLGYQLRGDTWEIREAEITETLWQALLAGGLSPEEQDNLHWRVWEGAA